VLNGLVANNDIDFTNTSAALFGQLSWRVSDRLRVEPGLRLNYDEKNGSYISVVTNGAGVVLPTLSTDPAYSAPGTGPRLTDQRGVAAPQSYEADFSDWNFSGDLKLAYEFSKDVLAYANYGRSFKTGGITLNGVPSDSVGNPQLDLATVRPEKVYSYELGVKTQFLGRRATLNVAAFRTDVKDFQATVNNGQVLVTRGYLANAEKVKVQGLESDFSYRLNENWNVYVNGAYTDATYAKFTGAPCPPELSGGNTTVTNPALAAAPGTPGGPSPAFCDVSGSWLPGVSKWSGSWGVQYQHAATILGREGEGYFGYDGSARSRWSSNPSRSLYTDVGGYGLANFRFGFRSQGSWDVYAWVRNAFDKDYFEQLATTPGNTGLIAGQPADSRTWGLTLRAEF
jgi:iron complex outermembrane receptor protein